ncbi:hypothetical protein [Anaerovorax odorimutans]|uniref:hypothetical protein n=1 Tax=Anaerovorax odorimutans TaxID=109327 RepID=UPI000405C8D8|nr:hypothetical protein [Anaerovorax odorimutans]
MKLIHKFTILFCLLLLIAITIMCTIIFLSDEPELQKVNTMIQGTYTIVTIVLVILTFSVLITSKEQNFQMVLPDIIITDIDLIDDTRNELDYEITNTGRGKAYNIDIKIYKRGDKKPFYKEACASLDVINSELIKPLYEIVNKLEELKNELKDTKGSHNGIITSKVSIYDEINLLDNYTNYYSIIFDIEFDDFYSNRYKNTFEYEYDKDEYEYCLVKSVSKKINSSILSIFKK